MNYIPGDAIIRGNLYHVGVIYINGPGISLDIFDICSCVAGQINWAGDQPTINRNRIRTCIHCISGKMIISSIFAREHS